MASTSAPLLLPPGRMASSSAGIAPWTAAPIHPAAARRLLVLRPLRPPWFPLVVRRRGAGCALSSVASTATGQTPPTLRDICRSRVPEHILQRRVPLSASAVVLPVILKVEILLLRILEPVISNYRLVKVYEYLGFVFCIIVLVDKKLSLCPFFRAEDIGFTLPTEVQRQSLPVLLSGKDCVLQAQTGSGKTLAYLLLIFSVINFQRSAVQALVVVPTRELGMQVTRVARMLSAKPIGFEMAEKTCTIMALLDGGMLKRHKTWLKADPPEIVVATIKSLCQMLEKHILKLEAIQVLVVDEVDFMFNSSKQVQSLRKLLTSYSSIHTRQTIFASASIPQHNRFLYDCVQHKWTKSDVVHIHVNAVEPLPSCLRHRYMTCRKEERLDALLLLLQRDAPGSGIIFVNDQSERSKRAGDIPSTLLVLEFLKASYGEGLEVLLLEENMNFNARATSLSEVRQGSCLLVATDIAARGVDLPETTHIYNFDLPKTAVDYLHRAGRTGRRPFSDETCIVTSLISQQERFVLKRFENELMFECEELQTVSLK